MSILGRERAEDLIYDLIDTAISAERNAYKLLYIKEHEMIKEEVTALLAAAPYPNPSRTEHDNRP